MRVFEETMYKVASWHIFIEETLERKTGYEMKKEKYVRGSLIAGCMLVLFLLVQGMLWVSQAPESVMLQGEMKEEPGGGSAAEGQDDGAAGEKVAYLTFDDGPSKLTEEYLDILKEEGVPATFFVIGEQIDGELVGTLERAIREGHEIGLHSYCHRAEEIYQSGESYLQDLQKTRLCVEEKLKVKPVLFRFPWGSSNSYVSWFKKDVIEQMKGEGVEYADWNVSGEDSVGCPSADSILSNVRKDYLKYDEPVILLHDSAACRATLESLPAVIHMLKEQGYRFATLSTRSVPCHFGGH